MGKSQPLRECPGGLQMPEWRPFSWIWRATVQAMTPELIGILSVGAVLLVGLGGLNIGIAAWLRADVRQVRDDLGAEIRLVRDDLGAEIRQVRADLGAEIRQVRADVEGLRTDVHDVDRRLARVEGVIEGMAYANGRDPGEGRAA